MSSLGFFRLIGSIIICQLAGLIGSFFTVSAIPDWYANLNKPAFSPPNWVFGPTWIVLYTLMGIALYLIWEKLHTNKKAKGAIAVFLIHLFFNATWSIVFFGLKNILLALANIAIPWILILVLMFLFYKIDKRATYLFIPYFLWVSFAAVLNVALFILN